MYISRKNRLVRYVIIAGLVCFFVPSFAAAEKTVNKHKIYVYLLTNRLNTKGTLSYNKLLDYAMQDVRDAVEIIPAPLRRSALSFVDDKSSCVFPSAIPALRRVHKEKLEGLPLTASAPIDYVSIRLYTKATDPVISTREQLDGKVVGHLLGSVGTTLLDAKGVTIQHAPDETRLLKMLYANRLDVLMGHHPDTPMAIDRLGLGKVHYDPKMTVYRTPTYIVCHKFDGVEKVMRKISVRLREMRGSGLAKEMLGNFAEIVPLSEDEKNDF